MSKIDIKIHRSRNLEKTIIRLYEQGHTDYYLPPVIVENKNGNPKGRLKKEDTVIFCCRRGDREYQLARALSDADFEKFSTGKPGVLNLITFTNYHSDLYRAIVLFERDPLNGTLGQAISSSGLRQARLAESEKFNHVTYFFNGHRTGSFPGEDQISVKSPEGNKPFENPELSAPEVGDKAISIMKKGIYSFILINFANGDVIGHFPQREAQLQCAEALDNQLGRIVKTAKEEGYTLAVTADHGVFELMEDSDGKPSVSHTTNPVPFIIVPPEKITGDADYLKPGILANVAPTMLRLMNIPVPQEMSEKSLNHDDAQLPRAQKIVMVIMDGWGLGKENSSNPIYSADTPVFDEIWSGSPHTQLVASGEAVGLLTESAGNSEAGHTNLAAGRIVHQDERRISSAIKNGTLGKKPVLRKALYETKNTEKNLHLLGLLSDRSSHGRTEYVNAIIDVARSIGVPEEKTFVHFFTDGRSTEPGSILRHLDRFQSELKQSYSPQVVTLIGRGIALDRDRDWIGKTKIAYEALTEKV